MLDATLYIIRMRGFRGWLETLVQPGRQNTDSTTLASKSTIRLNVVEDIKLNSQPLGR